MAVNNALNITSQGTVYFNGTNAFSEIDGSTSGFVLTSNGTGVAPSFQVLPGSPGLSGLTYFSKVLTSAQVKALHATPVQIVAAQGAGKLICILGPIFCKLTYGGTNPFTSGGAIGVAWASPSLQTLCTSANSAFVDQSVSAYAELNTSGFSNTDTSGENKDLVAYNVIAAEFTGNAANNNTVTLSGFYYVITI